LRSEPFVQAVHSRSREGIEAALAPDVRFFSPVVFRPYRGREVVTAIIVDGAMRVFENFEYVHRFEQVAVAALIFRAEVGGREVDGLDLLSFDEHGLIVELKVMVRPASGLAALAEAMGRRFEELGLAPPSA
jgi:hypothetical protein